jgi:hypothetical protein
VSSNNSLDKWRPEGASPAPDTSAISKGELKEESEKTVEKLRDLLRLAQQGEEDAVPQIRQILSGHPDLARRFVDVAHIAEDALIEEMTKEGDLAAKELIRCQLEAMREQIADNNCSAWSGCSPSAWSSHGSRCNSSRRFTQRTCLTRPSRKRRIIKRRQIGRTDATSLRLQRWPRSASSSKEGPQRRST